MFRSFSLLVYAKNVAPQHTQLHLEVSMFGAQGALATTEKRRGGIRSSPPGSGTQETVKL